MRKMSIKSRVALWYAFSLTAILILVAALILAAGDRLVIGERTANLMTVTDQAVENVKIISGKLTIDEDMAYYNDGIYVVIYRDDGTSLSGLIPEGFPKDTSFVSDQVRRVRSEAHSFFVYDRLIENQKLGRIWVRGVTSARLKDISPAVMRMLYGFLVAVPLLFVIALAGGWILTRQAFAPLTQIVSTADEIRKGGKLDQRIGLGNPEDPDEIQRTAAVFDEMLDQIEKDFEKEKQFTNDASHELRTPVAVIMAQSEYALDNLDRKEETRESLLEIRNQAGQMSSLLEQLLTMARADRNIDQLRKETADVSLLAEESAQKFRREAGRRQIEIRVDAQECSYMDCDPLFIGRMFDNLIDNSLKYGRAGGRTDVMVHLLEDQIQIEIRDDGTGISQEDLPHIWDRFYRGKQPEVNRTDSVEKKIRQEDDARSMGLGLSMVRWIVEAHNGSISVSTRPGSGTAFRILFPARQAI